MAKQDTNLVVMTGNLTRDCELKYAQNGNPRTTYSIAVSKTIRSNDQQKEVTYFHNCIMWGKYGETMSGYLKKGQAVLIEGELQSRSYQDNNGQQKYVTEIEVKHLRLIPKFSSEQQGELNGNRGSYGGYAGPDEGDGYSGNSGGY